MRNREIVENGRTTGKVVIVNLLKACRGVEVPSTYS